MPAPLASILSPLLQLKIEILNELHSNLAKLVSLNPSRREAVARHLYLLAGQTVPADTQRASELLRTWIEAHRTESQSRALSAYLEEVALIFLGQAVLLKAWSDRGIRPWRSADLANVNWALGTALKPHIPLDREGWQITRPNLYSWYNPGAGIQTRLRAFFDQWQSAGEGPGFLASLIRSLRLSQSEDAAFSSFRGYDSRFFKAIWQAFDQLSAKLPVSHARTRMAFSPTLRDGSMIRNGPIQLNWVGVEISPFQILIAELTQLWWGPAAPPLWAQGTGLEVHARDQMAFSLASPKPSLVSRITEMESCEVAMVLEERCIRPQARVATTESKILAETMESLPYFKKLRSPGTTLGDLQACVALSKLRPGGLLWWAREEPISAADGQPMLNFLLERAQIVCEWDFTQLKHQLPSAFGLYPKHLFLLRRDPDLLTRRENRPLRVALQGQVRSHVELPIVLEDALRSALGDAPVQPRGHWLIQMHRSPVAQQEWAEHWPDPACQDKVRSLEKLEASSLRLAHFATVRPSPEVGARSLPKAVGSAGEQGWSMHPAVHGLWVRLAESSDKDGPRKLRAEPLPRPGNETTETGFVILVGDETWVAPLCSFLESKPVSDWLDHHAERKSGRWVLQEQIIKWIPIPKSLLLELNVPQAIEATQDHDTPSFALPLPGEWEQLASEVAVRPARVRERLAVSAINEPNIHAAVFLRASRALETSKTGQTRLDSLVDPASGAIRWAELAKILPKAECVGIPFHSKVQLSGNLPPHSPVVRTTRVKTPSPGILLATDSGFTLHIGSDEPIALDMLWAQLEELIHPTWSEILDTVRLPRRLEIARETADELLHSHGQQCNRIVELRDLLDSCQLF